MIKINRFILLVFLLTLAACPLKNPVDLSDAVPVNRGDYDSIARYTAVEITKLDQVHERHGVLTVQEENRYIRLGELLNLLDRYYEQIQELKVDPTVERVKNTGEVWTAIESRAKRLGWRQ